MGAYEAGAFTDPAKIFALMEINQDVAKIEKEGELSQLLKDPDKALADLLDDKNVHLLANNFDKSAAGHVTGFDKERFNLILADIFQWSVLGRNIDYMVNDLCSKAQQQGVPVGDVKEVIEYMEQGAINAPRNPQLN